MLSVHVCMAFLAQWSLYVSLLHVSVFFLLNHHHPIYRYNHHICVSGAFVLVDGWKTLLAQTLPWTVQDVLRLRSQCHHILHISCN